MKNILCLMVLLLCLSGCSGKPKEIQRGMELRTKLLQASECSFDADITADYGDKLHTFSVSCQANDQGAVTFTVTAPETIAGITGTVMDGDGRLTFAGTALQFDTMADGQVTPVMGPWILLKTLRSGYLSSACEEDGMTRLTMEDSYEEDALLVDIWLNEQNMPVRGEILYQGRRIVTLDVKNLVIV